MKRITITLCSAAIIMFSCNDNKSTDSSTTSKDSVGTTAMNADTSSASTQQDPPMDSAAQMQAWMSYMTPGDMHKMMAGWNGTWAAEITSWMAPGAPPSKNTATEVNRMILGGRYSESRISGNFDGMPFEGIGVVGYDNLTKKFQSTWVDNMGTGIILMEGTMDTASRSMTMTGNGIDPTTGKLLAMRQVFTETDENNHKMEMYCTKNGSEFKTMEMMLKRK